MGVNPDLLVVRKPWDLDAAGAFDPGDFLFAGTDNILKRMPTSAFYPILNNIAKPISPTDPTPTVVGWYKPQIASELDKPTDPNSTADWGAKYPNAGNLRAKSGYDTLFYFGGAGVWKKAETKIPGNSPKKDFDPLNDIDSSTMKAGADRWDKINILIQKKGDEIANASSCTWVDGQYYNANGTTGNDPNTFSRSTNYITVIPGDTYGFINNGIAIIWYNDNNAVVGASGDSSDGSVKYREFVAPVGATKARVNVLTTNKPIFSFIHYPFISQYKVVPNVIKLLDIDGIVSLGTEIANYSTCTWVSGFYLDNSGVAQAYNTFSYCSNYIPVISGQSYSFMCSGISIIWYNSSKAVIGAGGNGSDGVAQRVFVAPPNAAYCRINQQNTILKNFSFRLLNAGASDSIQIPSLQINSNQIIGNKSYVTDQSKLAKIGDVKLFNFNSYPITGNIITSGDSTIAAYAGGVAVSSLIKCTGTITDISVPGETIAQQLAHWNSLPSSVKTSANYIFVQIGLNDMGTGTPESTIIQNLKNYFTAIRTASPSAIIVAGEMLPCRQRYINILGEVEGQKAYLKWKAVNASLPTITEVNKVATVHGWLLNDGNDNLKAEFDTGDAIHETTNGRKMIAYSWLISTL